MYDHTGHRQSTRKLHLTLSVITAATITTTAAAAAVCYCCC